jgi:hypothetical protein
MQSYVYLNQQENEKRLLVEPGEVKDSYYPVSDEPFIADSPESYHLRPH